MVGQKGMVCIAKVRPPSFKYKIRQLTTNNATGDSFGITVPAKIAVTFTGVLFQLQVLEDRIVFVSGAIKKREVYGQNQNISTI